MKGQHTNPKGAAPTLPRLLARLLTETRTELDAERTAYGRHALNPRRRRHTSPA
ncbi:MAG TPA: hypothetical protein VHX38_16790 [Pseudonocardiaceae bacterium]|jgi:hypothetical protein|nr:hypothetical protein [Pseudonocardiaceae bacterium]